MVPFVLANRFPQLLWWGPDYIQIYNDAYAPILGAKHPRAMGIAARECWTRDLGRAAAARRHAVQRRPGHLDRGLRARAAGATASPKKAISPSRYSPVPDETAPRGIGGVLATVHEITEKVIGERRVGILRELGAARGRDAHRRRGLHAPPSTSWRSIRRTCRSRCSIYSMRTARELRLVSRDRHRRRARGPGADRVSSDPHRARWPLAEALRTETMQVARRAARVCRPCTFGASTHDPTPWPSCRSSPTSRTSRPARWWSAISPRIRLDELYASFLELVGSQIATAVANARAYEEERRRAEALAEIDRAKTAFFSNVSHEFRTPLTLMLGPLRRRARRPRSCPRALRAQLEVAHRNALRLLKLVNSLLDFARIEAGRVTASFEPVDLAALTADLSSKFRSAMERAGLEFEVDCPPLDEPVHVDREMWEKIVLNLLSNAFKFTLDGPRRACALRATASHAVLEVADTGVGVARARVAAPVRAIPSRRGRAGAHPRRLWHRPRAGAGAGQAARRLDRGRKRARARHDLPRAHSVRHRRICPRERAPQRLTRRHHRDRLASRTSRKRCAGCRTATGETHAASPAQPEPLDCEAAIKRFASTFGARIVLADDNADMRALRARAVRPLYDGRSGRRRRSRR